MSIPPVKLKPELPQPSSGPPGPPPPNPPPPQNWEQLIYQLLQHVINAGQLTGNSQYQTIKVGGTYQRLFQNQQSAPKPYVLSFVQNLSLDPLSLSFGNPLNPTSQPQDTALGHGRVLNAADAIGNSGGWIWYPNIDLDRVWVNGATAGDGYYVEWYI